MPYPRRGVRSISILIGKLIRPKKKLLNCFSGYFFKKQMGQGRFFFFYLNSVKKQMQALFFMKVGKIFFKSCACTVISSQAIKLDRESICTSSRFDFITNV